MKEREIKKEREKEINSDKVEDRMREKWDIEREKSEKERKKEI